MIDLLFVYGTLLISENEYAIYLQQKCTFVGNGFVKGSLYDIGNYPGIILNEGDGYVHGSVYRMNNVKHVLARMDFYEGYSANEDQPNLYVRKLTAVHTADRPAQAWVYEYNLPLVGLKHIESGDYLKHLNKKIPR